VLGLQDGQHASVGIWEVTYRVVLIGSAFLSRQRVSMKIRHHHVGVDRQLSLE